MAADVQAAGCESFGVHRVILTRVLIVSLCSELIIVDDMESILVMDQFDRSEGDISLCLLMASNHASFSGNVVSQLCGNYSLFTLHSAQHADIPPWPTLGNK